MKRIPYQVVALELEKLYDFSITDEKKIDERCVLIENFLEACGWTIQEYYDQQNGFNSN